MKTIAKSRLIVKAELGMLIRRVGVKNSLLQITHVGHLFVKVRIVDTIYLPTPGLQREWTITKKVLYAEYERMTGHE